MSVNKLFKNSFTNSAAWILSSVIAFLTTPFYVYKLGLEGYGIYALFGGIVGYYGLLDLGLGQGVIKYVAKFKAINDDRSLNLSINSALWVQLFSGIMGTLVLIIFADNILFLLNISDKYFYDAKLGLIASAIGFFFTMLTGTIRSALMGLQRYDLTSLIGVASNLFLNSVLVIFLVLGYGLREILLINASFGFVLFAIYLVPFYKLFPGLKPFSAFEYSNFLELLQFSIYIFLFKITALFNNQIVRFFISMFAGPAAVTLYVVPMKIISALGGLINNITVVLFPYTSELESLGLGSKIKNLYLKSSRYLITFSTPIYLFVCLFSFEIMAVWMGENFANSSSLITSLLALSYLLSSFTMVPANIVLGMGHSKIIAFFSIVVFVLGTIIIIPATYYWGVTGTACGMLITQIEGPVFIAFVTRKYLDTKIKEFLRQTFLFPLIASVFYFSFVFTLKTILEVKGNYFLLSIGFVAVLIFYLFSIATKWLDIEYITSLFRKKFRLNG